MYKVLVEIDSVWTLDSHSLSLDDARLRYNELLGLGNLPLFLQIVKMDSQNSPGLGEY